MSEKINILGVDDRSENLFSLEAILEDLDVNFIKASSGDEALEYLLREEFALILMDVNMPDMDGFETAVLIRGRKKTRQIPIIFISATNTAQEHIFKGYDSGAVDYLSKPINPDILKSKVQVFAELFRQRMSLEEKAQQLEQANARISLQRQALSESEFRFRTAFEQSFQFMAILDAKGRVLELNRLAKKLCGDTKDQLVGQYLWHICWLNQEEENLKLQEVIQKAAAGECINDEALFFDTQGQEHTLLRAVSPVKNEQGEIINITFQGHDISKRIEAESEKKTLEALLRQAQKMEALGTLAGGIAHDFNNILGAIIGYANLAEKGTDADSLQTQYLRQIANAGKKAKDLVKQILSFSRQTEVERVVLRPSTIIVESVKLLRASIPSTIEIIHDVDPECGSIFADPIQYHQIIMNLCTNAFHALEETGGTISVQLFQEFMKRDANLKEAEILPGDYAHLIVEDDGDGIRGEDLEKIYDPYFTTKGREKGTGMGLSIVHGIVKSHGGYIDVDSSVGKGTKFHVYLPLVDELGVRREESIEALSVGTESILFVDDEEPLLEIGRDMLQLMGYKVTVRKSSKEALALFQEHPGDFDLAITDQTMPEMTGTELSRKILSIRPDIPVILCTGYSPNISQESVVKMGIRELAHKPLAIDELSKLVRRTLDEAKKLT